MKLLHGDRAARDVSERIGAPETSLTTLKQVPANRRVNGQIFEILTGDAAGTFWRWVDAATCNGDDVLAVTPSDAPSTGRFMRCPGEHLLEVTFYGTTPSGTALLTIPSGSIVQLDEFAVTVSRRFTGVATAVAGLSSSNLAGHTGAYQLIGSCIATQLDNWFSPTAAATGTSFLMAPLGIVATGFVATGMPERPIRPWLKGGDTLRYDGGGWGTGIGQWLIAAKVLKNPGV